MAKRNSSESTALAVKLSAAVTSNQHCIYIPSEIQSWDNTAYRAEVREACRRAHYPVFEMQGSFISAESLLFALIDRLPKPLIQASSELSTYRKICAIFDHTEPSVIVIYDAHKLNQDGQQIVARVSRYLKRNLSNWKLLLTSDEKTFKRANYFHLPIEHIAQESASAKPPKTETSSLILGIMFVAIIAVAATLFLKSQDAKPNLAPAEIIKENIPQARVNDPLQPSSTISSPNPTSTNYESGEWLSNEEFNEIIARLNAPDETNQRSAQPSGNAKQKTTGRVLDTEMYAAVQTGDHGRVNALLDKDVSILGVGPKKQTALIVASINGDTRLVHLLLEKGATIDSQDVYGRSALYYAAVHGKLNTARILLAQDANPNLSSELNKTPLMAAVHNGYLKIVRLLIGHGANLDTQDHSGWSAIFYAVWNDNLEMVEELLKHGADLEKLDTSGNSLAVIARARNHRKILDALKL